MDLILFAGPIGVGKTTVAKGVAVYLGGAVVSARELLLAMTAAEEDRLSLQRAGQELDRRTNGRWLLEALIQHRDSAGSKTDGRVQMTVLDSARTVRQTEPVLDAFTGARLIYLDADRSARLARYVSAAVADSVKRHTSLDRSTTHATERNVELLKPLADAVIDSTLLNSPETIDAVLESLGLRSPGR